MRGVDSYGMICGAEEVFMEEFFPESVETTIVDLDGVDCKVGQNMAEVLDMCDYVLEIDNKSLTNRPDLWGHYGIARELSAIYDLPLKELDKVEIDKNLPKFEIANKSIEMLSDFLYKTLGLDDSFAKVGIGAENIKAMAKGASTGKFIDGFKPLYQEDIEKIYNDCLW